MVPNRFEVVGLVVVTVLVMLCDGVVAQSGCRSALVSLSPCLGYVGGNSSTPTYSCCSELANVVKSQSRCLCTLVNNHGSAASFKINETLALGLPDACNVQTPPISRCDGFAGNGSQTPPGTSEGTTINLSLYFNFLFLLVALNLFV